MIDVHCHLNFKSYTDDVDDVIVSALKHGVTKIINVGTKIDSSQKAVELAEKYEDLWAIVGIHPHHADKHEPHWEKHLNRLADHPKVLAIGEIGMDYYSYKSNGIVDPKLQRELFIKQIEIAHTHSLPLQIHNRHAASDIVDILQNHRALLLDPPGMFHCFAADLDSTKKILDMGFYLGFDGNITYPGLAPGESVELRELISYAPLERIVCETDSPYLTPIPHRGERNKPEYVILVGQFISQLKGVPYETVVEQTTENVYTMFKKLK